MVKLCSLPQNLQLIQLNQGDYVCYVGADRKIQQDYGNQSLRILAINVVTGITVCENKTGNRLVGVCWRDLQRL